MWVRLKRTFWQSRQLRVGKVAQAASRRLARVRSRAAAESQRIQIGPEVIAM